MRLLCVADHVDPFIYSNGLKTRFGKVDLVLSAGDLALGYYDFIISTLNKPLLFVFGNHDLESRSSYGKRPDPFIQKDPSWTSGRRRDVPGGEGDEDQGDRGGGSRRQHLV